MSMGKCAGCQTQQFIVVTAQHLDPDDDVWVLAEDDLCEKCWAKAHNAIWPQEIPVRVVDKPGYDFPVYRFCQSCGSKTILLGRDLYKCPICSRTELA